jgi:hypothetical protein
MGAFSPTNSAICSLAEVICGWTRPPRPQSVPADEFNKSDDAINYTSGSGYDIVKKKRELEGKAR